MSIQHFLKRFPFTKHEHFYKKDSTFQTIFFSHIQSNLNRMIKGDIPLNISL